MRSKLHAGDEAGLTVAACYCPAETRDVGRRLAGTVLIVALGATSCGDKSPTAPAAAMPGPAAATATLRIVGAPTASVPVGQTIYLRATQQLGNNTTSEIISGMVWSSSSPAVSITPAGVATAVAAGQATITLSYLDLTATAVVRVVVEFSSDLDFRVVILNATSTPKPDADVLRIFGVADALLAERTGSHMRLLDMKTVEFDSLADVARTYLNARTGEQPDGMVIWYEDATAVGSGGYSTTLARPEPYVNRYTGNNRVFLSAIHYEHKYSRCGYDSTGDIRISERSGNGECRNQSGLTCVDNGRFWECPDARETFYAQPDVFTATTIVHEFMHPVGTAGNNDHYGTPTCRDRMGMSNATANDLTQAQWHCGMCPDVFLRFRPMGAPASQGRGSSAER